MALESGHADSGGDSRSITDSNKEAQSEQSGLRSQVSFRKKLAGKLKTIHTSSLPVGRGGTPSSGGSLRMKLIEKHKPSSSVDVIEGTEMSPESQRKSTSLQALASNYACLPSVDRTSTASAVSERGRTSKASRELANGSSGGNSTGGGKGSRSSGLQDAGSDLNSIGGLDTAISHHHAAASLTRFDTDNRDFDRRLADVIQGSDLGKSGGYLIHRSSLNPWTLRFKEGDVEEEYRAHFALAADRNANRSGTNGSTSSEAEESASQYRYSGVFIDILVAGVVVLIVSVLALIVFGTRNIAWLLFLPVSLVLVVLSIALVGVPLLRRRTLLPCVNLWVPRHIIGLVLIALPSGAALCNVMSGSDAPLERAVSAQLACGYILLIAIFCHCNFSQLGCWPKTLLAALFGVVLVALTNICLGGRPDCLINATRNANSTILVTPGDELQTIRGTNHFNVPLFSGSTAYRWEVMVDVLLALLLIGFLNYEFEAGFRMSFFGDVQARRDTAQMQIVRDQADWLLTNIIPQHAVEELKVNTKYSENHQMTAVLFASITNWNEMYEENFEGGREFLRVLNEVIGDFDELLDRPQFSQVEKIKTIGSSYMAASGLNPERRKLALHPYAHLYELIEFALALQEALRLFNQDLLNFDFVCKLGVNIGPVTAGVIGTTKLYYDIWGDTVNIASRMYSTGVVDRIQVSQYTRDLLCDRYDFEFRDHIEVKGIDTGMDTYLLVGRKGEPPFSRPDRESSEPMF
uniref:adenylate cyclase n=1 Tax=Plectus sambesii TaxID=2011161 RepID=A0A914VMG8_9BILA